AVAGVAWNQAQKSESMAKQAKETAEKSAIKAAKAQEAAETQEALAKQSQEKAEEASANLSKTLTESDFITGTEYLESGKTPEGLAYLARAIRRDPSFWQATTRAMSVLEDQNFNLNLRPPLAHDRPAQFPIVSKDESRILTYVSTGEARVWDSATGELVSEFGDDIFEGEIASDGKVVALQNSKNQLILWDATNGKQVGEIKPEQGVRTFTFARHKTKDYIATFNVNGSLQLWNLDGSKHSEPLKTQGTFLGSRVTKPGVSTEGNRIYGMFNDGRFASWDVETGKLSCPPILHGMRSNYAELDENGSWCVIKSQDLKSVRWWSLETGNSPMSEPIKLQRPLRFSEFSPNANRLYLIGPGQGRVSFSAFDVQAAEKLYDDAIDVPARWVNFGGKHGKLIISQDEFNLKIVDLRTNKTVTELPRQEVAMGTASFNRYGDRFAVIHNDNTIRIRRSETGSPSTKPLKHDAAIQGLKFNETGTLLATRDTIGIRIWNTLTGELISGPLIQNGFSGFIENPFVKKHNTLLAWDYTYSGTSTGMKLTRGMTRLWSTSIRAKQDNRLEEGVYGRIEFTPDNKSLIAIKPIQNNDDDRKPEYDLQLWDLTTQSKQNSITYTNSLSGLRLHPTMDYIFLSNTNKVVNILNQRTLKHIGKLTHPTKIMPSSVIAAKDEAVLAVATEDSTVHLWDVLENQKINKIETNHPQAYGILSDDGKILCTYGGDDYVAFVWNVKTGERIAGPFKHGNVIISAYFQSAGNGRLITLTGEPKANIWDIGSSKLLHAADTKDWPTKSEIKAGLLMTAGNGNPDYPSAIRLWDAENLRSTITPIDYNGAIQRAKLMRDNELVAAYDNKKHLRVWGTKLGRPLTTAEKNISFANFGAGNHFATDSSSGLFLHNLPEKVENCPDWFPDLLESLGGKTVNEQNIFADVPKDELEKHISLISGLPNEIPVNRWGQWFISANSDRPISPYSTQPIKAYLENLSKSEKSEDLIRVLLHQPGNSLAKSRLAVTLRRWANLRYETPDKAFDNNIHTRHLQYKTTDLGIEVETKLEIVVGMTVTT
ncbi:MAG: WD40 repeat domain-containing protein, partial [Pseudomonadota bacterium]|nr:WD40 repeat domain-containing protein [Pseudomonadota bacterium]